MPFTSRVVEPVFVCRGAPLTKVKNDLEAVAVHSTCELIRQMTSINDHATNLFKELTTEIDSIVLRTNKVSSTIESIIEKSKKQKKSNESNRNWRLDITFEQPFSRESQLPDTIQKLYFACEEIPKLEAFDKYRKDGKSSLKLYTNPDYALEQWIFMMKEDMEIKKHKKQKVKKNVQKSIYNEKETIPMTNKRIQNQINQVPEWERSSTQKKDEVILNSKVETTVSTTISVNQNLVSKSRSLNKSIKKSDDDSIESNKNVDISTKSSVVVPVPKTKPPLPSSLSSYKNRPNGKDKVSVTEDTFKPLPIDKNVPSSKKNEPVLPIFQSLMDTSIFESSLNELTSQTEVSSTCLSKSFSSNSVINDKEDFFIEPSLPLEIPTPPPLTFVPPNNYNPPKLPDVSTVLSKKIEESNSKSDLLTSIRSGMNLKRVEISEKKEQTQPTGFDSGSVAAMLARRQAMQDSDSDDETVDDDDWD